MKNFLKFKPYYSGPKTDHFDGNTFFNSHGPNKLHSLKEVLAWQLKKPKSNWPKYVANNYFDIPPISVLEKEIRISFVGHVTLLIQTQGLNLLTDPVWSDRASPFQFIGPKRINKPGIDFDNLPPIDVIWISHNHYDHLDLATLKKLWIQDKPRIITPLGNDTILKKAGIDSEAYDLGDQVSLSQEIKLHLEPMLHWSARGLFDKNKALWAAMVLTTPFGNFYFIGDSGYGDGYYFRQACKKFKSFKIAFLPIGAYEPRWFMRNVHMNPHDALNALQDLGSPLMVPIHYDTFPLADEEYGQALKELEKEQIKLPDLRIKVMEIGEFLLLKD